MPDFDWIIGFDPSSEAANALVAVRAMRDRTDKTPEVRVIHNAATFDGVARSLETMLTERRALLAVERVRSQGQSGDSLLRTSEVVGRMRERAERMGYATEPVYRTDVLRYLDCFGGKGTRDAKVKAAISRDYGFDSWRGAVGKKAAPGPLYGLAKDGWAALGVALTAAYRLQTTGLEGW